MHNAAVIAMVSLFIQAASLSHQTEKQRHYTTALPNPDQALNPAPIGGMMKIRRDAP